MKPLSVLVTGASRGIGRDLVRCYAAAGHRVFATMRDCTAAGDLLALRGVTVLPLDVADDASVRAARRAIDTAYLNVVINNAAINGGPQRAPGMDMAQLTRVLAVNALGAARVYDAFVDLVRAAEGPRAFVNVSSEAGSLSAFRASRKPDYAMSKAALNALTRWIASQEPTLVCTSIDPGWTRTAMGGDKAPSSPAETAARLMAAIAALTPAHSGAFVDSTLAPLPW